MFKPLLSAAALLAAPLLALPGAAQAAAIDNSGIATYVYADLADGPDMIGGTFIANDEVLESFSLAVSTSVAGLEWVPVVFSVSGGAIDSMLWSGNIVSGTTDAFWWTMFPDLTLSPGEEYFIGLDIGLYTLADNPAAGLVYLGATGDQIPGAFAGVLNSAAGGFSNSDYDVASLIVMNDVPLPAAAPLLLAGLGGLAALRRRR